MIAIPWMKPPASPTPMAPIMAANQPYPCSPEALSENELAVLPFAIIAATRPATATSDPTDRSMPAVRMTNVMPIAINPSMEI